jgi:iron complex outermembrane receptor protein
VRKAARQAVLSCGVAALGLALAAGPAAAVQPRPFNIPPSEAVRAIPEFARQAGVQIIAPARQLRGLRTPALRGLYEPRQALAQLIAGAGLEVASDTGALITLRKVQPVPPPPEPPPPAAVEEVVVTGTLIARSDTTASQPVSVVSGGQLRDEGQISLLEILRRQPAVGTGSYGQSFSIGGAGVQTANLRNAGSRRTLVLVNGRRFPIYSDINGFSGQDIGLLPTAGVERVELLRDGAATTYGADAVAGVVNVITRQDFDGLEMSAYAGGSSRGDAGAWRLSTTAGRRFDRGSIVLSAQIQDQDDVLQKARAWARNPVVSLAGQGITGSASSPGGALSAAGGQIVACYPVAGGANIAPNCQRYDPASENSLIAAARLRSLSGSVRYDLTDEVTFKVDGIWSHRDGFQSISGAQLSTSGATGPFPRIVIPAGNSNNPFGRDLTLNWRLSDYGSRPTRSDVDLSFVTAGLEGRVADRFHWELSQSAGRNAIHTSTVNGVSAVALNNLLNPQLCAGQPACAAAGAVGNIDALLSKAARLTAAQQAYLFYDQRAALAFTSRQTLATIGGPLLDLPAGQAMFAAGLEHREEKGVVTPDAFTTSGNAATNTILPTHGRFTTDEVFGELTVPLLAASPGVDKLEFDLQGRHSHFSNFGKADVFKVGLNWAPIEALRFRGSYGTSFRAPDVIEAYGGGVADAGGFADPCNPEFRNAYATVNANCTALGVPVGYRQAGTTIPELTGGNPGLKPERGKSFNAGLVFKPVGMPGFTAVIDYYDLKVRDAIGSAVQANLNACYQDPNLRARAADVNDICYSFATRNADGSPGRILARQTNIGLFKQSGLDFTLQYARDEVLGGRAAATLVGTYLIRSDAGRGDVAGTYSDSLIGAESNPRWRGNLELSYGRGPWSAEAVANYVSAMDDTNVGGSIPADNARGYSGTPFYVSVDLTAKYRWGATEVAVGVNNVFDREPPYAFNVIKNTLISTYDIIGRYGFVTFTRRF